MAKTTSTQTANQVKNYHLVGIGGTGMSGLAQILRQLGHRVSGSDMQLSASVKALKEQGVPVRIGHDPGGLSDDIDCLVVSAAITPENPEWQWATEHGIRVRKYAQMLGELSDCLKTIAVAGTHGKSTTSAWLTYTLREAGMDPSFVIGAPVPQLGGASAAGKGGLMVVEACEYDRSFMNIRPHIATILNIEHDHLDYYKDLDEIRTAFGEFAEQVSSTGLLILNGSDANITHALTGRNVDCESFCIGGVADWQTDNLSFEQGHGTFDLLHKGDSLGRVRLSLPGAHNVMNALAVTALAHAVDVDTKDILHGLQSFNGVERRMTDRGEYKGIRILDDYAHHPTEIRITLQTIRARYTPKRLWCVFQPHQHSRTRFLMREFAGSFASADVVLLPDIYFVRDSEEMRGQVNAQQLANLVNKNGGQARYLGGFGLIVEALCAEMTPGDVVVTLGAGDVWKIADELLCRLGKHR